MTPHQIARLSEMEAAERASGPFIWNADEMQEYEALRMAKHRLIAAAPDMLEALHALVWQMDRMDDLPDEVEAMISEAKAAIVKAEGN